MLAMMRRWLGRGVDGFRLDVFNAFFKHADLPDLPARRGPSRGYDRFEHVHDKNQPEMIDFLGRLRAVLDERPGQMAVGEFFGGTREQAAGYVGPGRLDLLFEYRFLQQPWNPAVFQRTITEWDAALARDAWPCYALGSHDESRMGTRLGGGRPANEQDAIAKVVAAMLLTLRGTPFVYNGEEIAMRDEPVPPERVRDTPALRFAHRPGGWRTRDPARTPMQWGDGPGAGFTTGRPWLPLASDHRTRTVAQQAADPRSVLNWYRRLIWFPRGSPALRWGTWRMVGPDPREALVFVRETTEQTLLVALNFAAEGVSLDLADVPGSRWTTRLGNARPAGEDGLRSGRLVLAPYEAVILEPGQPPAAGRLGG